MEALDWKESQLNDRAAVCSKHFRSTDYYPGLQRIYLDSVPTLNLNKTGPKGKSKSTKKPQLKKVSEKQSNVKTPGRKSHNTTESTVSNAKGTLASNSHQITSNSGTSTNVKPQSLLKENKKVNQDTKGSTILKSERALDSSRKLLTDQHESMTLKKCPTAYQRYVSNQLTLINASNQQYFLYHSCLPLFTSFSPRVMVS